MRLSSTQAHKKPMAQIRQSPVRKAFLIDWPITNVLSLLTIISVVAIYAASPLMPGFDGSYDLVIKQLVWIGIALTFLIFLLIYGVDVIFSAIDIAYWVLMVLLVLLVLDHWINLPLISPINGTRAWITLPGMGTLQPSEFMKAVLMIKTSLVITKEHEKRGLPSYEQDFHVFYEVLKVSLLPLILIVLQPDTGIPLIIVVGLVTMLAVSGIQKTWIQAGFVAAILLVGIVLGLFFFAPDLLVSIVGKSYRLNRFYGWLQTENYIRSWGLQLYQSLLAVGSAGWFGHGLGSKVITLIEPQNDFIFAVIGQNFGFVGTSITLMLHLSLDLLIVNLIINNKDYKERLMISGVLGMLVFQQVQNMGMIIGLLPITGITLPFISSGGSSLLSFIPALAVIFHISNTNQSARRH